MSEILLPGTNPKASTKPCLMGSVGLTFILKTGDDFLKLVDFSVRIKRFQVLKNRWVKKVLITELFIQYCNLFTVHEGEVPSRGRQY